MGIKIYPKIQAERGDELAKKLTGMILDEENFPVDDIKEMIKDPKLLMENVETLY